MSYWFSVFCWKFHFNVGLYFAELMPSSQNFLLGWSSFSSLLKHLPSTVSLLVSFFPPELVNRELSKESLYLVFGWPLWFIYVCYWSLIVLCWKILVRVVFFYQMISLSAIAYMIKCRISYELARIARLFLPRFLDSAPSRSVGNEPDWPCHPSMGVSMADVYTEWNDERCTWNMVSAKIGISSLWSTVAVAIRRELYVNDDVGGSGRRPRGPCSFLKPLIL